MEQRKTAIQCLIDPLSRKIVIMNSATYDCGSIVPRTECLSPLLADDALSVSSELCGQDLLSRFDATDGANMRFAAACE